MFTIDQWSKVARVLDGVTGLAIARVKGNEGSGNIDGIRVSVVAPGLQF